MQKMLYFSSYCNKYNEIKMCDLEPFSEIWSHIIDISAKFIFASRDQNAIVNFSAIQILWVPSLK